MIVIIFVSYLTLIQQADEQPQWNYVQKILEVYMCSGDPTRTDRISDSSTRSALRLLGQFLCNDASKKRIKGDKEIVKIMRELNRKSDDFRCYKRAHFSAFNKFLCTKPVLMYDAVSRLIDDQYRHCPSENNDKRNRNMVCVFLRYSKRLQIRNELYTLFQTLNVCPRITSRSAVRTRHRVKRQFDMQSLIFLWNSFFDNQGGFDNGENTGSLIEQMVYMAEPLHHCIIRVLTKTRLSL